VDRALVDVTDGFASGDLHADFGMRYWDGCWPNSDSKDFGWSLEWEMEAVEVDPIFDMSPVDLSADGVVEEENRPAVLDLQMTLQAVGNYGHLERPGKMFVLLAKLQIRCWPEGEDGKAYQATSPCNGAGQGGSRAVCQGAGHAVVHLGLGRCLGC
jgi:hypothetical protein